MSKSTFWAFFFFMISVSLALSLAVKERDRLRANQAKIKPCKCLTIKQILFHVEKREMFVDMLQRAKKKDQPPLIDSINYHNSILDSTGNIIEY